MKAHIESLKISKEEKDNLLILLEPSFAFRYFLSKQLNISPIEVETIIQDRIASKREELNKGLEGLAIDVYIKLSVKRMSDIMADFAKETGFKEYEAFGISLGKIMEIGLRQQLNQKILQN
jgi:PIN domain nuclease of toxin-antitoxin system